MAAEASRAPPQPPALSLTSHAPTGSYVQAAEKSFSLVRGGRSREAAALAWERQGPTPDRTSYRNWAKSILDNPAVIESQVGARAWTRTRLLWLTSGTGSVDASPAVSAGTRQCCVCVVVYLCVCVCVRTCVQVSSIIDLVRRVPCAVTKRRHLRRALLQYLDEFDSCRCAPCPNNARAVLSGTECTCVCQTGTFGSHCEKRAPDFSSGTGQ